MDTVVDVRCGWVMGWGGWGRDGVFWRLGVFKSEEGASKLLCM